MARVATVVAIALALAAAPAAQQERAPAIVALLDAYDRGEFAAAVKAGAAVPDLADWRTAYPRAARAWIDASPSATDRRRLVAAGLALEVTRERYERDVDIWSALRHVVEWTCTELVREPVATRGEHAWHRASVAFGQRVHDPSWLALGPLVGNHLEHVWRRFPADPRFALASVVIGTRAADTDLEQREQILGRTKRLAITTVPPSFGGVTGVAPGGAAASVPNLVGAEGKEARLESLEAVAAFTRLLADPEVGAEAEAHVSHLYLMLHDWQPALDHARAATRLARDGRQRYLGLIMSGLAHEQLRQPDDARLAYRQALEALPNGQAAALLQAALGDSVGVLDQTPELVRRSLAATPLHDDPWRLYYYGDYFNWSAYIGQLHEALR